MNHFCTINLFLLFSFVQVTAQIEQNPLHKCGYYSKNLSQLKKNYDTQNKYFNVIKGENIASIGASNGYVEIEIATYNDIGRFRILTQLV